MSILRWVDSYALNSDISNFNALEFSKTSGGRKRRSPIGPISNSIWQITLVIYQKMSRTKAKWLKIDADYFGSSRFVTESKGQYLRVQEMQWPVRGDCFEEINSLFQFYCFLKFISDQFDIVPVRQWATYWASTAGVAKLGDGQGPLSKVARIPTGWNGT